MQSQGISAKSNSGDYTLKILSYEDGSYCCTGAGCKKLNKNYPDCAGLSFPTSNCAGTEGGTTPPGGEPTPPGGESTPVEPVEPEEPECADGEVQGSQACNGCGVQTTQKCVGGKWKDVLGECSKTQEECSTCTEGETRKSETSCGSGCGVVLEACIKGKWQGVNCVPKTGAECTPSILSQETCPDGSYRKRTCNTATCKWGDWDKECSAQDCSNAAYKASHKAECCPGTPTTDTVCWTPGPLYWGTMQSVTDNDALFRCNQKNMYDPHRTCAGSCVGKASVSNSYCSSVSGSCSNYGEVCMMQITYCPIFTGTYNYGKPNCDCQGGEVLNRTYKSCVRDYLKNGW